MLVVEAHVIYSETVFLFFFLFFFFPSIYFPFHLSTQKLSVLLS